MKPQNIMKQFSINIIDKTIITNNYFFKVSIKLGGSACSGTRMSSFLSPRYYFVTIFTVNMFANSRIILCH